MLQDIPSSRTQLRQDLTAGDRSHRAAGFSVYRITGVDVGETNWFVAARAPQTVLFSGRGHLPSGSPAHRPPRIAHLRLPARPRILLARRRGVGVTDHAIADHATALAFRRKEGAACAELFSAGIAAPSGGMASYPALRCRVWSAAWLHRRSLLGLTSDSGRDGGGVGMFLRRRERTMGMLWAWGQIWDAGEDVVTGSRWRLPNGGRKVYRRGICELPDQRLPCSSGGPSASQHHSGGRYRV